MDSDDDLRRHCLDDVAHPSTCHTVFITVEKVGDHIVIAVRRRRSVRLAGNVALASCGRRWGDRTVAGGGGYWWRWKRSGRWRMMVVVEKKRGCLLMMFL